MRNFHSLEVVGRGSESQLQVGGNLNNIAFKVLIQGRVTLHSAQCVTVWSLQSQLFGRRFVVFTKNR